MSCFQCNASDADKHLRKCPICYRHFCDDCGVNRSGRWFCAGVCADYFFYGEDEDDMEE